MIKIAIIYGGRSGEHDVSCASAASIMAHLDRHRYDVTEVQITKEGGWLVNGVAVGLTGALRTFAVVDVVFPALHGPYGEDGTIQALLEFVGVPYVGNPVRASAAGMDKEFTKKLLAAEGLRVADGVVLRSGRDALTIADKLRLGLPVFVKPARSGSSIGVTKVTDWDELPAAIASARIEDAKVLVEQAVAGREVDVAVLEHPDGRLAAGPPLEIRVSEGFFDYPAKYDHGAVFDIPARLQPSVADQLQETAMRVFQALDCRGLLRVDFFLPEAGGPPVVNEVNTFPGFTAQSQYPQIWRAAGLGYVKLLDTLIEGALSLRAASSA